LPHQRFPTWLCDGSDAVVQSAGDNVAEESRGENREAITESASLMAVTALGTVVWSAHANLCKHPSHPQGDLLTSGDYGTELETLNGCFASRKGAYEEEANRL